MFILQMLQTLYGNDSLMTNGGWWTSVDRFCSTQEQLRTSRYQVIEAQNKVDSLNDWVEAYTSVNNIV